MSQHNTDSTPWIVATVALAFIVLLLGVSLYAANKEDTSKAASTPTTSNTSTTGELTDSTTAPAATITPVATPAAKTTASCDDVTSYDHNWQNDVKCTRPDGSTFYTDYAGGREADPSFEN
jgi:spore germination protein YaaH